MELAKKIHSVLSPYPRYFYNAYLSFYYAQIESAFKESQCSAATLLSLTQPALHDDADDDDRDAPQTSIAGDDDDDDIDAPPQDKQHHGEYTSTRHGRRRQQQQQQQRLKYHVLADDLSDYSMLKERRKESLIHKLQIDDEHEMRRFQHDAEFNDFVDLIACLLDLNPATRYTSEDAMQHTFVLNLKYIEHDAKMVSLLSNNVEPVYPAIGISTDQQRQSRVQEQQHKLKLAAEAGRHCHGAVPVPREAAVTRKHSYLNLNDENQNNSNKHSNQYPQLHNKVVCLIHGCCNNPTIVQRSNCNNNIPHHPPAKKFKYSN